MNVTLFSSPPPHSEDVPLPPPLLPVTPPSETNEILTNLVNLLQHQDNRLERVEKNQEKIPTEVATQIIEEAHKNKCHTTLMVVDNVVSITVNRQKGGKKPPDDSDKINWGIVFMSKIGFQYHFSKKKIHMLS